MEITLTIGKFLSDYRRSSTGNEINFRLVSSIKLESQNLSNFYKMVDLLKSPLELTGFVKIIRGDDLTTAMQKMSLTGKRPREIIPRVVPWVVSNKITVPDKIVRKEPPPRMTAYLPVKPQIFQTTVTRGARKDKLEAWYSFIGQIRIDGEMIPDTMEMVGPITISVFQTELSSKEIIDLIAEHSMPLEYYPVRVTTHGHPNIDFTSIDLEDFLRHHSLSEIHYAINGKQITIGFRKIKDATRFRNLWLATYGGERL